MICIKRPGPTDPKAALSNRRPTAGLSPAGQYGLGRHPFFTSGFAGRLIRIPADE